MLFLLIIVGDRCTNVTKPSSVYIWIIEMPKLRISPTRNSAMHGGFLSLPDIDFNSVFSCPDCGSGDSPETVICDGTSLSFQRCMQDWAEKDTVKNVLHFSSSEQVRLSYFIH